jgi:phosphoenolpyruvate synthase/pyruvate phosphate dikinase
VNGSANPGALDHGMKAEGMTNWIRWFDEVGMDDLPAVGGTHASLAEMRSALTPVGIPVTEGIERLSLNPDSQLTTMLAIVDLEQWLAQRAPATAGVETQAR